jgi:hypothetical protein
MNRLWKRLERRLAVVVLGIGLIMAPTIDHAARAQEPADAEAAAPGSGTGRPLDGYLGTVVLVLLAFFIVGKSARR